MANDARIRSQRWVWVYDATHTRQRPGEARKDGGRKSYLRLRGWFHSSRWANATMVRSTPIMDRKTR